MTVSSAKAFGTHQPENKGLRRNLSKVVYTGEEGFLADETF